MARPAESCSETRAKRQRSRYPALPGTLRRLAFQHLPLDIIDNIASFDVGARFSCRAAFDEEDGRMLGTRCDPSCSHWGKTTDLEAGMCFLWRFEDVPIPLGFERVREDSSCIVLRFVYTGISSLHLLADGFKGENGRKPESAVFARRILKLRRKLVTNSKDYKPYRTRLGNLLHAIPRGRRERGDSSSSKKEDEIQEAFVDIFTNFWNFMEETPRFLVDDASSSRKDSFLRAALLYDVHLTPLPYVTNQSSSTFRYLYTSIAYNIIWSRRGVQVVMPWSQMPVETWIDFMQTADSQTYIDSNCYLPHEVADDFDAVMKVIHHKRCFIFSEASERLRDDKEVVLAAVKVNPVGNLRLASERLRGEREVVMTAMKEDPYAFISADSHLRDDRIFARMALKKRGSLLAELSQELQNDRDIVEEAMSENSNSFKYASSQLKTDDVLIAKYLERAHILEWPEIVSKEVSDVLDACSEKFSELYTRLPKHAWKMESDFSESSENDEILFMREAAKKVLKDDLKWKNLCLEMTDKDMCEIYKGVIKEVPNDPQPLYESMPFFYHFAALAEIPNCNVDLDFAIAFVRLESDRYPLRKEALSFLPMWNDDERVVLQALERNSKALQFVSPKLRGREDILRAALRGRQPNLVLSFKALDFLEQDLIADPLRYREFALFAIEKNGMNLLLFPRFLADETIVASAVEGFRNEILQNRFDSAMMATLKLFFSEHPSIGVRIFSDPKVFAADPSCVPTLLQEDYDLLHGLLQKDPDVLLVSTKFRPTSTEQSLHLVEAAFSHKMVHCDFLGNILTDSFREQSELAKRIINRCPCFIEEVNPAIFWELLPLAVRGDFSVMTRCIPSNRENIDLSMSKKILYRFLPHFLQLKLDDPDRALLRSLRRSLRISLRSSCVIH